MEKSEDKSKTRTLSISFGKDDEDLQLALNRMSVDDDRSYNNIIHRALKPFLQNHGYLDENFKYVK